LNNLVHRPASAATTQALIAMGRIVGRPSIKARSKSRREGLRKLSPDLISKARDETATQVTRIGLTFLGTTAFCLLSLLSPDSALLGGNEKINVPLAGPVSFSGFMLLGPTVLIVLRVYLQIYVEHSDRLDRLARSVSAVRAPTLVPLRNPPIRVLSGLTFYLLLPVAMMLFAWKAAVFPTWGAGLLCVARGVVVSHVMLPFSRFSWRSKALLSVTAAIISGVLLLGFGLGFGPVRRPFDLHRANLSGQWLAGVDLRNADLGNANLSNAILWRADLRKADLGNANLSNAKLWRADLRNALLLRANLSNADLSDADLSDAYLNDADLSNVDLSRLNLTNVHLFWACGNANTKLPEGFTLKLCSPN
jgi:Pentapeptide repeats (8 copies)